MDKPEDLLPALSSLKLLSTTCNTARSDSQSTTTSTPTPGPQLQNKRNIYSLPVELNASIINDAIGSSLHTYFMSSQAKRAHSGSQAEDEWAKSSFFIISSVSYSFHLIIQRTIKQLFDVDTDSVG